MRMWKNWIVLVVSVAGATARMSSAQASTEDPEFARLYSYGQSAMAAGRYDEARADFERLEKMDSGVAEVHATLGLLCFKAGSFDHAIEEIRVARKLKPELHGLDTLLSLSLAESGKFREAMPGLERAFKSSADPESKRQAGLELARVYSQLSMDRRAAETALELRDLYKDDPEVLYSVGKTLGNSAYLTMQHLFHESGASVWARLAEAEAQESQGQFADAIQNYRSVLEMDPHRVNVHYRMGRTYLSKWQKSHSADDVAAAEDEFTKEIAVNPGNANAGYELAGLRWKDGNQAAAEQLYEAAIRNYPDFEEAEVGLGGILLDEGKPALAVPHLQRATALRAEDEVAWYRLAQADRMLGDLQAQKQALASFQKLHAQSTAAWNKTPPTQAQEGVTPQTLGNSTQ